MCPPVFETLSIRKRLSSPASCCSSSRLRFFNSWGFTKVVGLSGMAFLRNGRYSFGFHQQADLLASRVQPVIDFLAASSYRPDEAAHARIVFWIVKYRPGPGGNLHLFDTRKSPCFCLPADLLEHPRGFRKKGLPAGKLAFWGGRKENEPAL